MRRLIHFSLAGYREFLAQAGILTLVSPYYNSNVYHARLILFSSATTATWIWNREIVCRQEPVPDRLKVNEYSRYLLVQTTGGGVSSLIFTLLIIVATRLTSQPSTPIVIGAILGFVVNFTVIRNWAYPKRVAYV